MDAKLHRAARKRLLPFYLKMARWRSILFTLPVFSAKSGTGHRARRNAQQNAVFTYSAGGCILRRRLLMVATGRHTLAYVNFQM